VTGQEHVPEILYLLNREPLTVEELSRALNVSTTIISKLIQDLARINAIVERNGKWHVAFPIFAKEDLSLLSQVARKQALNLAEKILDMRPELEEGLSKLSCANQVEIGKIALAAVGCYILDWRALELLNEKDLTLCGKKQQPGNRRYVLLGREEGAEKGLIDKLYWGSHSETYGRFKFTSFGDHTGHRYAFPDVSWTLSVATVEKGLKTLPGWYHSKIAEISSKLISYFMADVGNILLSLCKSGPTSVEKLRRDDGWDKGQAETLLRLLADMKYIRVENSEVSLNYPVFTFNDSGIIEDLWHRLSPTVEVFIVESFDSLKTELASLTPIRKGIDPREIFTDVWHWIFGWTNRIIAERGFFYDPPREREGEARYIAWVEEKAPANTCAEESVAR
jgi:DNA-binding MarR family transcriptional regulator